jgi:hypothetical protein
MCHNLLILLFLAMTSVGLSHAAEPATELPIPRRADTVGKIDSRRGLTVAAGCISTFFNVHLKDEEPSSLERLPSKYPELAFGPGSH